MSLPPLNIRPPSFGQGPTINLGPPTLQPVAPTPTTPGSAAGAADPTTIEGRLALRNKVRESSMTDQIRGILTKQGTGQTLSSEEQLALRNWQDDVEATYSRTLGIAIPDDVQRRIQLRADQEQKANQNQNQKSSGGSGGGRSGGGAAPHRAAGGGAGAGAGGAHPPAGGARTAAGAGAGRAPAAGRAPRPAAPGATPVQPTPQNLNNRIRQAADSMARDQAQQAGKPTAGVVASPQGYETIRNGVRDVLANPDGKPRPGNAQDAAGAEALKRIGRAAWIDQYLRDPNSLSPQERTAFEANGALRTVTGPDGVTRGQVASQQALLAVLREADKNPGHPLNTYVDTWIGSAAAGQDVPLGAAVRTELGQDPGRVPSQTGAASPTGPTEATNGPIPAGMSEGALPLHPEGRTGRPTWVDVDGRMVSVEPDGSLTEQGTDPGAFAVAQRNNQEYAAAHPPGSAPAPTAAPAPAAAGTTVPEGTTIPTSGADQGVDFDPAAHMLTIRRTAASPGGGQVGYETSISQQDFDRLTPEERQRWAILGPAQRPTNDQLGVPSIGPPDMLRAPLNGTPGQGQLPGQPQVLTDQNSEAEWAAAARAAFQKQAVENPGDLNPADVQTGEPSQAYIDAWRGWYSQERDAGRPPDLQAITNPITPAVGPQSLGAPGTDVAFNQQQAMLQQRLGDQSLAQFANTGTYGQDPYQIPTDMQTNEDPIAQAVARQGGDQPTDSSQEPVDLLDTGGGRRRRGDSGGSDQSDKQTMPWDTGWDTGGTEQQPSDNGGTEPQPSDSGNQPSDGGNQPSDSGNQPSDGEDQPSDGGDQPSDGGDQPSDSGDNGDNGDGEKKPKDPGEDPGGPVGRTFRRRQNKKAKARAKKLKNGDDDWENWI